MKLEPHMLIAAYSQGIFPMAEANGDIYWYDPDPRAIIPLETFRVNRRLARTVRNSAFEIRLNTSFPAVMRACAERAPDRPTTWISEDLIAAYTTLHRLGLAHSVETWQAGALVGGLYGVTVRGLFAGESMFSRATDASKVALVHLVDRLRERGFLLLDTQFSSPHMARLGAIEIPRADYKRRLAAALRVHTAFCP